MPFQSLYRFAASFDSNRSIVSELILHPSEFLRPGPHGFVADDDPAHRQQVLDHSQAEGKTEIEPNRMLDDLGGNR